MLTCPFCGAAESDRIDVEEQRFVVFPCMFTAAIDPKLPEADLPGYLQSEYGQRGSQYFRGMCDRLHLVVAREPSADTSAGQPPA